MFILTCIEDSVPLPPSCFHLNVEDELKKLIVSKYIDKVLPDIGLVSCFSEFAEVKEAVVYPGDGSAHYKVSFNLVVFKPFLGEVIIGRISSCDKGGVNVSLGFFKDIKIPCTRLQQPAAYLTIISCSMTSAIHLNLL
eukprot:GHVR01058387.1.p1 GENE.GHVR01058387.1~~GHVR01058387.1.p1  ORF type:complete len:138 (+),score=24.36 GHVR01058387.1:35-448(+)